MSAIPLIFTSGWASGINAYAVVAMLGLLGRFGHMSAVPPTLERTDVLAVACVLFLCEFVADKIPLVDSAWDVAHTAIRPILGGAVGVLMAHHAHGSLTQAVVAAVIGGGTALTSHTVKAGVRIGVNSSPEPVTNSVVSILEDLTVGGMVVLVLLHPLVAAVIALTALVVGIALIILLAARIRRYLAVRKQKREEWRASRPRRAGSSVPAADGLPVRFPSDPASPLLVQHSAAGDQDMGTLARGLLAHGRDVAIVGKGRLLRNARETLSTYRRPRK